MLADNRPIGVFDSGVGGLTVLRALQERLPAESTIYLGDLARCPYGTRPQRQVREFAVEIGDLLASLDIKALVVACNTATAAAYNNLADRYPFPVVGVIEPGAEEAVRLTGSGRIGIVATAGTVASGAYRGAVLSLRIGAVVVERSASWLVPIIERGALARPEIEARLRETLVEMRSHDIDTLILGCTHFPIVRDLFDAGAGDGVTIVDSAATTADVVARLVQDLDLMANVEPVHRILVTGSAEAFAERAQAMFRSSPRIEEVDLALDVVPGRSHARQCPA